jgi:hypothetical protein
MPLTDTLTDTGSPDYAAALQAKFDGLTRPEGGTQVATLTAGAGTFPVSYPVSVHSLTTVAGAGKGTTKFKPSAGGWPPLVPFDGAAGAAGVDSTYYVLNAHTPAGLATYVGLHGRRTRGTAVGVFCSTPLDCGPAGDGTAAHPGGWPDVGTFVVAGAFLRNGASWGPCGLCGCVDDSLVTSSFAADASPWLVAVDNVGGVLSVKLRLKDDLGVYHDFSFPMTSYGGDNNPVTLGFAFQVPITDAGSPVAFARKSASDRPQVALTGTWPAGRTLAHNFTGVAQVGGAGPRDFFGERYGAVDLTAICLTLNKAARYQDRGAGQQQRLIGQVTDLGAAADSDYQDYVPASPLFKLNADAGLTLSPKVWHYPWYGASMAGFGYWLPADGRLAPVSDVTLHDLTLLGSSTGPAGGAALHFVLGNRLLFRNVEHYSAGQHAVAKIDTGTTYPARWEGCETWQSQAAAWLLGYGIYQFFNVSNNYWGRVTVCTSKAKLDWDIGFNTDSVGCVHILRYHSPRQMSVRGVGWDIESNDTTAPSGGHVYANTSGSDESNPAIILAEVGFGGGRLGVPACVLDGPPLGTPEGPANRPSLFVVRDTPADFFTGSGSLQETRGGLWTPYIVPQGGAGPPGPQGDPGLPGLPGPRGPAGAVIFVTPSANGNIMAGPVTGASLTVFRGVPRTVTYSANTDLTGLGLAFTVRDRGGAQLLRLTSAAGRIVITDVIVGNATWDVLPADVLSAVPEGQHDFDVTLTDAAGTQTLDVLTAGELTVRDTPATPP